MQKGWVVGVMNENEKTEDPGARNFYMVARRWWLKCYLALSLGRLAVGFEWQNENGKGPPSSARANPRNMEIQGSTTAVIASPTHFPRFIFFLKTVLNLIFNCFLPRMWNDSRKHLYSKGMIGLRRKVETKKQGIQPQFPRQRVFNLNSKTFLFPCLFRQEQYLILFLLTTLPTNPFKGLLVAH